MQAFAYLLVPLLALLLVSAQACWASAIKADKPFSYPLGQAITTLLGNPKIWIGGLLYVVATLLYFLLLSRYKFFSIQTGMTGLAIVLSTLLSVVLFHEKLSLLNGVGMLLVLIGIFFVFSK